MAKLWIFGDSFAMPLPTDSKFDSWPLQVARKLGVEASMNFAMPGVSNDYIFYQLTEHLNSTEKGDFIIIQTTNKNRQWFFEDPVLCNYNIRDIDKFITKDQSRALKEYILHLQKDGLDEVRYLQFSLALERVVQLMPHARFLILPGFHQTHGVEGSLIQVCDSEFVNPDAVTTYYNAHDGKDPRNNHLSRNNHNKLTEKIIDFFNSGKMLDLTVDFEKHFLE